MEDGFDEAGGSRVHELVGAVYLVQAHAVLGDEGGAAAIVREATLAALAARDEGLADDGLLAALLEAFGVDALGAEGGAVERLTRLVNDEPTVENWAPRAPAVFAAAEAGSGLAMAVIEAAAAGIELDKNEFAQPL